MPEMGVPMKKRVFYGDAIHSLSRNELEFMHNALIGVSSNGAIAFVEKNVIQKNQVDDLISNYGFQDAEIWYLRKGEFLLPGLIDTHTHACQFPNAGYGMHYELMDWLEKVTFPTEKRFSSLKYAKESYESVVTRLISSGTTTAAYYASIHMPATMALATICHQKGQRAFVGKTCMDRHGAKDGSYVDKSSSQSLHDTKDLINFIREECFNPFVENDANINSEQALEAKGTFSPTRSTSSIENSLIASTSLVQPIITPRFAITCSDSLLAALGALHEKDPTLRIQTHLAENQSEISFTKELFPFTDTYTKVYDHYGLLNSKTILAHCVHLEDSELELIKEKGAGISHCPTSNFNLRSGVTNVGDMLDRGIKVGLGTDVSGGYSSNLLSAMREASVVSKVLSFQDKSQKAKHHSLATLTFLATLGGAQVCSIDDKVGNFEVGKEFDALIIQTSSEDTTTETHNCNTLERYPHGSNPGLFVDEYDVLETVYEKFIFCGDDRNISNVFVRGKVIGGCRPIEKI